MNSTMDSATDRTLGHILIADDSIDNLYLLSSLLTQRGYKIQQAIDGAMAVMTALATPPDVILLDVMMPSMDGYEVCRHLKSQTSTQAIPVIFISALDEVLDKVKAFRVGGVDFISKPFHPEEVLVRIEHQLELKYARAEISKLNIELEGRIQQRTEQLEQEIRVRRQIQERETLVNQIVQEMRQSLILEDVLTQTVTLLKQHLEASYCLVRQDSSHHTVIMDPPTLPEPHLHNLMRVYSALHNWFRVKLTQGHMLVCSRPELTLPSILIDQLQANHIYSVILAPLIYSNQYLGIIGIHQSNCRRNWTQNEVILIKEVADHCAIAIHQARLFEQANQKARRERLLNQVIQALNSTLDEDHILQDIVRLTGSGVDVDQCLLFSYKNGAANFISQWERTESESGEHSNQLNSRLDSLLPSPLCVVPSNLKRFSDWIASDPVMESIQRQGLYYKVILDPTISVTFQEFRQQIRTILIINVSIRGDFFGGIVLISFSAHKNFTREDIHLLQRIADQTATALYNANSYSRLDEMVQERTQELEQAKLISESANRAKSEFLATMSHELRTPLTSILTFGTLLEKQYIGPLSEKQSSYVKLIRESGEHLLELINDILELSKIEAGKEDITLEEVNVAELGESCVTLLREKAQSKGLKLYVEIQSGTTCHADKRRLKQILFNLLSNAVKFTEKGLVKLIIAEDPDRIYFAVLDTGIGISPEDQAKLFQPFQQLDSGDNRRYSGTGLGLALSRRLARLHGGEITVTSRLGQGSCFTLTLPLPGSNAASVQPKAQIHVETAPIVEITAPGLRRGRILLIEDNEAIAQGVLDYLKIHGYATCHFGDGNHFLERVTQFQPDLILMDVHLPERTGFELLTTLRTHPHFNQIPAIAVTASAMEGDRERCLQAGAWNYISKPIDFEKFKTLLRQYTQPFGASSALPDPSLK